MGVAWTATMAAGPTAPFHQDANGWETYNFNGSPPDALSITNNNAFTIFVWIDPRYADCSYVSDTPLQYELLAGDTVTRTWNPTSPKYQCVGFSLAGVSAGVTAHISMDFAGLTNCQYGTSIKPDVGQGILLTAGVITGLLATLGIGGILLAAVLDSFIGRMLWFDGLCSSPPPPMPIFTSDDFLFGGSRVPAPTSLGKWWTALQAAAWPEYCICKAAPPGGEAPVPYDPPVLVLPDPLPVGWTPQLCNNQDVCTTLDLLQQLLMTLQASVTAMWSDVRLIQRQLVPFSYVPGETDAGLSGSGEIAVQGILGLVVQSTAVPVWIAESTSDPTDFYMLGTLSFGTADGWLSHQKVVHNPHLFLPLPGAITRVGYSLSQGVEATFQWLVREA